jgi:hypothetical protein
MLLDSLIVLENLSFEKACEADSSIGLDMFVSDCALAS